MYFGVWCRLMCVDVCCCVLMFAGVCWCVLLCVDVCCCLSMSVDVCWLCAAVLLYVCGCVAVDVC